MSISKIDKKFLTKHLNNEEEICYVVHKHWISFIFTFIKWVFLGIILTPMLFFNNPKAIIYLLILLLFIVIMAIYDFFNWYLDVLILTDSNLIQAKWDGFFKSFASRTSYDTLGSVLFENKGLGSILNYGTIELETEGGGKITFKNASNPKKAEAEISKAKNKEGGDDEEDVDKEKLRSLLEEIVADHISGKNRKKRGFGE